MSTIVIDQVESSPFLPIVGYINDLTGAFAPIFAAAAILSLIGAGLFWKLGQPRSAPSQLDEQPAVS